MPRRKTLLLTQFSILLAIELILGLTPLGMIMVPPVSITLLHIPVIICGVVMGPLYGGLLGGAFGMIAMFKATTQAVSPADMLFSPFLSGRPVATLIMALGARILVGVIAAGLYRLFARLLRRRAVAVALAAVLTTMLHTVMVLGCFYGFFFQSLPLGEIFGAIMTLNGGLEILASVLVAVPVCTALVKSLKL